jgi:hypothetical protein
MYKFLISDTNRKQNNFLVFLKYRPSSHGYNKLVIKSQNACKFVFLSFCMEIQYAFIYIYLRDLAICSPIKQNFVFFLSEKNSREVFWYFLKFQRKTDTSISG